MSTSVQEKLKNVILYIYYIYDVCKVNILFEKYDFKITHGLWPLVSIGRKGAFLVFNLWTLYLCF